MTCAASWTCRISMLTVPTGCDGVVHVASNVTFSPDPNIVVNEAVAFAKSALESSVKEPKVKRFVMTSSSSAANQLKFNEPYDLTPESWNTKSVEIAWYDVNGS